VKFTIDNIYLNDTISKNNSVNSERTNSEILNNVNNIFNLEEKYDNLMSLSLSENAAEIETKIKEFFRIIDFKNKKKIIR
jgi:hypothetical protein